jgi:iron complex transport system substrate-binding protein
MIPQRIASLLASATEILYGLGLGDRVVAVSHECDFPQEAATRPRVTRTHVDAERSSAEIDTQVHALTTAQSALYSIDVEQLVALRPDLIVTQAQCDVCAVRYADVLDAVATRQELSQTHVVALNPHTMDDVLEDIRRVGEATGTSREAVQYVNRLQGRIDAVRNVAAAISTDKRPRVVAIEWIEPLMVAANWMPQLIDWAGGQQNLTQAGDHSAYSRWDDVRACDPEVIVIMPCGFDLQRTLQEWPVLRSLPGFAETSAVRNGRVYAVDGNAYFNRSGPRMVESLEILAHLVHPARFAPPADAAEAWKCVG